MIKINFFLLIVIFLAACSGNKPLTITLEHNNLKEDVKSVSETQRHIIFDEEWNTKADSNMINMSFPLITRFFNENGTWVKTKIKMNNKPYSESEVLFDEDGNYNGARRIDEKGDFFEEIKVIELTETIRKEETYDKDNKLISSSVSIYENNILQTQTTELNNGSLYMENHFVYDEKGNESEINYILRNNDSEYENKILVKYLKFDDKENWTERITYSPNSNEGVLVKRVIEYY